ncbi:MAG: flagellar brake protein [Proteobacteria bacterium]|nr:flagellar brake protein [Pseudomonadota bacterium]
MVPESFSTNIGSVNQKDLGVEWGMPLMISFQGFNESHKGILVGMDRGHYLICSVAQMRSIWIKVHKESHVVVRYLHKGVVYGFKSNMISLIEEPIPLMLLSYPEEIETVALRKHDRINCLIPATVQVDGQSYKGAILDMSLGGCSFVYTTSPESESSQVQKGVDAVLSIQIPGSQSERTVELGIVNVRREGHKITMGSQFKNLDTTTGNTIESYIQTMAALSG